MGGSYTGGMFDWNDSAGRVQIILAAVLAAYIIHGSVRTYYYQEGLRKTFDKHRSKTFPAQAFRTGLHAANPRRLEGSYKQLKRWYASDKPSSGNAGEFEGPDQLGYFGGGKDDLALVICIVVVILLAYVLWNLVPGESSCSKHRSYGYSSARLPCGCRS
jgi:hypothetical protein